MGGEHAWHGFPRTAPTGSSPRGRGTQSKGRETYLCNRFIPAWAGNTKSYRVRCVNHDGSSPRGRGTHVVGDRWVCGARFIPAWAGNTATHILSFSLSPVHPRVGGEHSRTMARLTHWAGSSPRGRGTHQGHGYAEVRDRFIPAWAGNTRSPRLKPCWCSVHPRVGGEHPAKLRTVLRSVGSSPRGRGTLEEYRYRTAHIRFIPAWAGNTFRYPAEALPTTVHPRVGGEHIAGGGVTASENGSSPRGRGTPVARTTTRCRRRFIPAWAGNTSCGTPGGSAHTVHPRVGGEHAPRRTPFRHRTGSSPRGRGTHSQGAPAAPENRFIPAWAGNTSA